MPKFSIAIPAHNRRAYLEQAIQWALNQTVSDWELVISDDCSTDDLDSSAKGFNDSRIVYFRSAERLGAAKNHQRAVELSKGEYVITLNSDDLLLPQCLEVAGGCLDRNPEIGAVYFSLTYLKNGEIGGFQAMPNLTHADSGTIAVQPWLEKFHGTTPSCCLFRRRAFDQINGYRISLRFAYDWDLYMRMIRLGGGVMFMADILGVYRKHDEQMVNLHSIDGLKDVLDLWRLEEYQHWPASDIADIVITEFRSLQSRRQSTRSIMDEVFKRRLFWKILRGLPRSVLSRIIRRLLPISSSPDSHYSVPNNLDEAIFVANGQFASRAQINEF